MAQNRTGYLYSFAIFLLLVACASEPGTIGAALGYPGGGALTVEYAGRTKDPWGGERVGFSAHTSIARKDFGLVWNVALEAGGVLVADKVDIEIELQAIKA